MELSGPALLGLLLVLGTVVSLDGTSVAQTMISRPLVAAPLAGWLAGSLEAGLAAGFFLELLYLPVLPVGGGRFPETGAGAVTGGVAAATTGGPGGLAAAVLLGVGAGALGGGSIRALRVVNGRVAPEPTDLEVTPEGVRRAHLTGIAYDAIRGAGVTVVGLGGAFLLAPRIAPHWPFGLESTVGLLVVAGGFALGVLLSNLAGARAVRLAFLGVGAMGGAVLALVLG